MSAPKMSANKKRAPLSVCALTEQEADALSYMDPRFIPPKCSSGRHPHYSHKRVKEAVKAGTMRWVGKHERRAAFVEGRSLMKVYRRTGLAKFGGPGEPTMQLVKGGALR